MSERLVSVGLDVGTTTTQLVVSALTVENRASSFAVPQMHISHRQILYESPIYFTPLVQQNLVDGARIRQIVEKEYACAGITRADVNTGAVIITGESSRKENAGAVIDALSEFAGDFVVATAGPHLESVLAAKGAGALLYSEACPEPVLHMDIGGGTSNLALIADGKILQTGCLNVGGRLIKLDDSGKIYYISPALKDLTPLKIGDFPTPEQLAQVAQVLTRALEMAAGLRPKDALFDALLTQEERRDWLPPVGACILSFSGGVADCIEKQPVAAAFGDIGVYLGAAIKESLLCRGKYRLGTQTIRATVIGAGSHTTQLSGSTVFYKDVKLPRKNLPVLCFDEKEQLDAARIAQRLQSCDADTPVLAMPGFSAPDYAAVKALAQAIARTCTGKELLVCLQADMAKALGHCLQLLAPPGTPLLCIDRVQLSEQSYLDIGAPVGPCFPLVIKTLVLSQEG